MANNNLHALSQEIEYALQKVATQTNIAVTALCEASEDTRKGIQTLDSRLSRLENDLDIEEAEDMDLYQVDAGDYQVDLPELTPPTLPGRETDTEPEPSDDLATVRNSIEEGKPDRDVLVEWVKSKRDEESSRVSSYNALANRLNESEIPTLSGRDHWSRSTVRNLIVRSQAEEVEKADQIDKD